MLISTGLLTMAGYQTGFIFASSSMLFLTASAPLFKEKTEGRIHVAGATLSMILGYLEIVHTLGWIGLAEALISCLIFWLIYKTNSIYKVAWIEGIGFIIIMLHLISFKL